MKILCRARLSRDSDDSSSIDVQCQEVARWSADNGHQVIGHAHDVEVSRHQDPRYAPELAPWVHQPELRRSYDGICVFKQDRLAVGAINLGRILEWAAEHDKALISVTDQLDYSTNIGQMIAGVVAGAGQEELNSIRLRNETAYRHRAAEGRYSGGAIPGGYRVTPDNGFELDPERADIVREVIRRIISGESLRKVRIDLNDRGIRSFQRNREWSDTALKALLTNPALYGVMARRSYVLDAQGRPKRDARGEKVYGTRVPVYSESGEPVKLKGLTESVITRTEFDKLQSALSERRTSAPKKRKNTVALGLGVLSCGVCGLAEYRYVDHGNFKYRCRSAGAQRVSCGNRAVRIEAADEFITGNILDSFGHLTLRERHWVDGNDPGKLIAEIEAELDEIASRIGGPLYRGEAAKRLDARALALSEALTELEAQPVISGGWQYTDTGQTLSEAWESWSPEERNQWLRDAGVSATIDRHDGVDRWTFDVGDLPKLLGRIDPEMSADAYRAALEAEQAENRRKAGIE